VKIRVTVSRRKFDLENYWMYYVNIEEYKDERIWNRITVLESVSEYSAKLDAEDLSLMFKCEMEILYEQ